MHIKRLRMANKEYFNNTYCISQDGFKVRDIVMLYNMQLKQDYSSSCKLNLKWLGLFRVYKSYLYKGWYLIKDLNSTLFRDQTLGNRLKKFY